MLTTKRLVALAGVATVAVLIQLSAAQATTTSDRSAAILIYPKIAVDSSNGTDTVVQLTNANQTGSVLAHCFYVNATSHCTNTGEPCFSGAACGGLGACVPGWSEIDFSVALTPDQPFYWVAGAGRNSACAAQHTCEPLPLRGLGVCANGGGFPCTKNEDCASIGGVCIGGGVTNAGTAVPPAPDDPFVGELKCVQINADGTPANRNDLIGKATLITTPPEALNGGIDAQSYNAVGLKTNSSESVNDDRVLVIGGPNREYQSCSSTLILDHIFDGAPDPIDQQRVVTDLTLVPCSEDFAVGGSNLGRSTAQFLVFNEFEQRFSASRPIICFDEVLLSNIDTRNNARSVFSVNVAGTIAGQTRIRAVGAGLVGVARLMKTSSFPPTQPVRPVVGFGAGYNLHQQGERNDAGQEDYIILP